MANNGSAALNGWTVHLTPAAGQTLASIWSGTNTGTSGAVTVRNAAYNGSLGASASTTFGFTATGSNNTAPSDVSCTSP
ncbi:cellulose binding domain-containing protein [Actinoplanes sp. NPDC051343]|uniref:cellulose binding domain-containing protein n=1 Tax=Actinoplanes sp. NPDC051343 TaxID=3363906 RepID=UPI0037B7AD8C